MLKKCLIVFGLIMLIFFPVLSCAGSSNSFSYTAIISQGSHHTSQDFDLDEGDKIVVSITVVNGGPVDLYLMTNNQYSLTYRGYNESSRVISYLRASENTQIGEVSFTVPSRDDDETLGGYDYYNLFDSIYVIVDNSNNELTQNDANTIGPVEVKIEVKIEHDSDNPFFDPFFTICIIIGFVIFVIVLIIIIILIRGSRRKREAQMFPPTPSQSSSQLRQQAHQHQQTHYQGYYQYPYWSPYGPPPSAPPEFKEPDAKKKKGRKSR